MRVKTEAKRDAIVRAASEVFREMGFEGASMSEIAARAGGSKATLYGYFRSKEELFVAVILGAAGMHFDPIFAALAKDTDDLERVLQRYGERVMAVVSSREIIEAMRAVIAESGRSDIGRQFFEGGPNKGLLALAGFLEQQMRKGRLRKADPQVAARHLTALLDSEVTMPCLLGIEGPPSRRDLREATRRAVQVFLGGYASAQQHRLNDPSTSSSRLQEALRESPASSQRKPAQRQQAQPRFILRRPSALAGSVDGT